MSQQGSVPIMTPKKNATMTPRAIAARSGGSWWLSVGVHRSLHQNRSLCQAPVQVLPRYVLVAEHPDLAQFPLQSIEDAVLVWFGLFGHRVAERGDPCHHVPFRVGDGGVVSPAVPQPGARNSRDRACHNYSSQDEVFMLQSESESLERDA